jgi:hypothetical protein
MKSRRGLSPFSIGAALVMAGSAWVAIAFSDNEKASGSFDVEARGTASLELDFDAQGTGFYIITIPEYSNHVVVFTKVRDPAGNSVSAESITTKMSVNYFQAGEPGKYTLAMSNSSNERWTVQAELGNTGMQELVAPFAIGSAGLVLVSLSGYARLRRRHLNNNYRTSQPEDSSS